MSGTSIGMTLCIASTPRLDGIVAMVSDLLANRLLELRCAITWSKSTNMTGDGGKADIGFVNIDERDGELLCPFGVSTERCASEVDTGVSGITTLSKGISNVTLREFLTNGRIGYRSIRLFGLCPIEISSGQEKVAAFRTASRNRSIWEPVLSFSLTSMFAFDVPMIGVNLSARGDVWMSDYARVQGEHLRSTPADSRFRRELLYACANEVSMRLSDTIVDPWYVRVVKYGLQSDDAQMVKRECSEKISLSDVEVIA